jgi:hypothetical protein
MELQRLKQLIDKTMEVDENNKYLSVVVTLSEPSIGSRSMVGVKQANAGFDWEKGQFRLEPDENIVKYGNSKENIIKPREKEYNNRKYLSCKICNAKVAKDDRYCKRCGQKIK